MASRALEVNLADYHVDVTIEERYSLLQEIMADYYGLLKRLNIFLKELSHPYKNWQFIVNEARGYSLDYFHLLKKHPRGDEAAALLIGIFQDAIAAECLPSTKTDAVDNLMLYLQKLRSQMKMM